MGTDRDRPSGASTEPPRLRLDPLIDILGDAEGDGIIGPDYTPEKLARYIIDSIEPENYEWAGAASTEATPPHGSLADTIRRHLLMHPDHRTSEVWQENTVAMFDALLGRASTEAAPPHEPVYLYWSEYDDSATVKGWGGDNIYKCRECPEWEGDSDSAPRHSAFHRRASTEATPPPGRAAAEWHRYLHAEGILVDEEPTVTECGPWHHRVFLDGPGMASTEATLPDHDCVEPSACGVTGFYCYNSRRASTEATERMRQNIAALRRDDDRDRYLRERFRQDVAVISGATEGPGLCPRCGVTLADTGYYEDGQRCHDPAEATERPDLRAAVKTFLATTYRNNGEGRTDRLVWQVPESAFGPLRAALTGASPSEPLTDNQRAGIAQQALLGGAAPEEEREPPEAQKSTADLALQRSKSRHAAWCFLPADHDGACDGDQ